MFRNSILQVYLPLITNNNKQNEYYLTSLFELFLSDKQAFVTNTDPNLTVSYFTFLKDRQHEMFGVNTPEELERLRQFKQWDYDPPWYN